MNDAFKIERMSTGLYIALLDDEIVSMGATKEICIENYLDYLETEGN